MSAVCAIFAQVAPLIIYVPDLLFRVYFRLLISFTTLVPTGEVHPTGRDASGRSRHSLLPGIA